MNKREVVSKTRQDESEQLEAKPLPWGRRKKAPRCQWWDPTLGAATNGFSRGKRASLGLCVGVQVTPNPAAPSSGYLQLPLEDVNLFAAVLCELYVPNVLGVCWCCLTSLLLDFPLPLISVSIRLVVALSRDASMGNRRNQAFNFRNCQKSSTRGKHNYFRSHAGF